jgi:predicted AlkP superfamily phosphohydrolase/phosphomutase/Tfp pilus assembly protein PilF
VTQKIPIEELLSPTSQFAARRDGLRQIVARHLGQSGLQVQAFEIARMEPDRRALLNYKRNELRRKARGVAGRVAIFTIDGADWELLSELSDDGRIPNLRALAQGGTTASMQTIQPTVSPLVWTTAATGLSPDRHGVIDFFDRANKAQLPVSASTRRTPALWEIAAAFGRPSVTVNWWTAWPASQSGPVMFDTPVKLDVPESTIGSPQVRRFLNITDEEYTAAVTGGQGSDPTNVFRRVLSKTWTDHRVALNLYQQQDPYLLMVHYEGTDAVNHLFGPYHPPYREGIPQTEFRKYWPAVANYYAEIDRLIGEWMNVLSDDTTVIVMSAHGYRWGKNRPRVAPAGRAAIADHRNPGIFIAYGNHVAASRGSHAISLYDVVPSVLAVLGLPPSAEMNGKLADWLFRDITPVSSVRVVSYEEFFPPQPIGGGGEDPKEYTAALQAIGHVVDPSRMQPVFEDEQQPPAAQPIAPAQWGAYAYYNNQGIQLRKQNKLRDATEAFQAAIDRNPTRPTPYLNMAMTLFDRQFYSEADNVFMAAVQRGLPSAEQWFIDYAALYRSRNMTSRAIAILYKGKQVFPQSPRIAANLGSALAQASRYTEGLPELERALALQPSSTIALNNIGMFYARQKDYGRALDFWNRSLAVDPRQPNIRQALEAVRTHL